MDRVMIIGCCGAGKSTLAREMHEILGIGVIHLDQYYWKPNWVETESQEWKKTIETLVDGERWIMDGNYGGTMDIRLERADTVLSLDYSTIQCLSRVIIRTISHWGKVRPDMSAGCPERLDPFFLHYVATFNKKKRPKIIERLVKISDTKRVLTFRGDTEVRRFIAEIS